MNPIDVLEKVRRLIGSILLNYPCTLSEAVRLQEALLKIELALETMETTHGSGKRA
jgi:hypothetical protein